MDFFTISGHKPSNMEDEREPINKVNALRQKLQLVYNIELSNATRKRYMSLFMRFVSQSAL